jgi:peptidoglycan/LPS O-acetylase OafA/YrhL
MTAVATAEATRFPALDGLRGIAVIAVFCTHAGPQDSASLFMQPLVWLARLGWTGVDLFFVLSGFLITGILVANRKSENYFRAFYWHRALRIFPLYFLLLTLVATTSVIAPDIYRSSLYGDGPVWPYWTFMSNLRPLLDMAFISFLLPTWSLAVEEQFYIAWSIIARFLSATSVAAVALLLLCVSIAMRFWMLAQPAANAGVIFYFTPTHLDGLCVGAVIRIAYDRGSYRELLLSIARRWWVPSLFLGVILSLDRVYGAPNLSNWYQPVMMHIGFPVIAWLFGALLLHGIMIDGWVRSFTSIRILRGFGKYSYCIYLYQNTVLFALSSLFPWLASTLGVGCYLVFEAIVIYWFGKMSYRYIEGPCLRLKQLVPYASETPAAGKPVIA